MREDFTSEARFDSSLTTQAESWRVSLEAPAADDTRAPIDPLGRFMKVHDVAASVGLSRAMVYRLMHEEPDPFPAPVKIGAASVWVEREVAAWKARRAVSRRGAR